MAELIVEPTEIQTYLLCPQQWEFGSAMRLRRIQPERNLRLGSAWHEAMKMYYMADHRTALRAYKDWSDQDMARIIRDFGELSPEQMGEFEEDEQLGLALLHEYPLFAEEADKDIAELLHIEQSFKIPLVNMSFNNKLVEVYLGGRIDILYADMLDRLWVMDHKTCRNFAREDGTRLDIQFSTYIWGMHQLFPDETIGGLVLNEARKSHPARARVPVFKRTPTTRTNQWVHQYGSFLRQVVEEMVQVRVENTKVRINPGLHCTQRCSYTNLCIVRQDGMDIQPIIDAQYTVSNRINWLDQEGE